jgi:hypothetical protein
MIPEEGNDEKILALLSQLVNANGLDTEMTLKAVGHVG